MATFSLIYNRVYKAVHRYNDAVFIIKCCVKRDDVPGHVRRDVFDEVVCFKGKDCAFKERFFQAVKVYDECVIGRRQPEDRTGTSFEADAVRKYIINKFCFNAGDRV